MKAILKTWNLLLTLIVAIAIWSCSDEQEFSTNPNHRLVFSTDTVAFDTLSTITTSQPHSRR